MTLVTKLIPTLVTKLIPTLVTKLTAQSNLAKYTHNKINNGCVSHYRYLSVDSV